MSTFVPDAAALRNKIATDPGIPIDDHELETLTYMIVVDKAMGEKLTAVGKSAITADIAIPDGPKKGIKH